MHRSDGSDADALRRLFRRNTVGDERHHPGLDGGQPQRPVGTVGPPGSPGTDAVELLCLQN
jgi:hypothetical protein